MLVRTALALANKPTTRQDTIRNRKAAKEWLKNKEGIVKFHDACLMLDVDPDSIKKAIIDYAEETAASPIKRSRHRPHSHVVFGRMKYATEQDKECT